MTCETIIVVADLLYEDRDALIAELDIDDNLPEVKLVKIVCIQTVLYA